jgi:hypothetical protein
MIWEYLNQEEVFAKYLYSVDYKKRYINPFRPDSSPGCKFTEFDGNIYFTDFSCAGKTHYNAIDVVKLYYNCNYNQAIQYMDRDFNLNIYYKFPTVLENFTSRKVNKVDSLPKTIKKKDLIYSLMDFNEEGLKFWQQFGFNVSELNFFKIKQIYTLSINGKLIYNNELSFVYFDDEGAFKTYAPYRSTSDYKFISIRPVLEANKYLTFQKPLIITKSYKDACILIKLGFDSFAPPSESNFSLILEDKSLLNKYNKVYILFDPDPTGIESAKNLSLEIPNSIVLNLNLPTKDISDYIKYTNDTENLKTILNNLCE